MLGSHRGKGYSRAGVGASRSCRRRHRLWAPHKDDLGQVSSPTVCLGSAEPRRRMRRAKIPVQAGDRQRLSGGRGPALPLPPRSVKHRQSPMTCPRPACHLHHHRHGSKAQNNFRVPPGHRPPPTLQVPSQASPLLLQRWDSKRSISRAHGGLSGRPLTQWETKRSQRWGCFPPCQRCR